MPKVSLIMPCRNSAITITQAINSVLSQNYSNIELIIIDDHSTDSSVEIINNIKKRDNRIRLLLNKGKHGVSFARNLGIKIAKGRFICFLDADDYLLPESISRRVRFCIRHSAKVVFGPYSRLLPNGNVYLVNTPKKISFSDLLKKNFIGNLTGMYDTNFFGKAYQENIRHEDYLMWCKLLKRIDFAHKVGNKPLGVYRVSKDSLSGSKFKASFWHWMVLRRGLNLNFIQASFYQIYYVTSALLNRLFESASN